MINHILRSKKLIFNSNGLVFHVVYLFRMKVSKDQALIYFLRGKEGFLGQVT